MPRTVVVQLDRPICSATVQREGTDSEAGKTAANETTAILELEKENLTRAHQALAEAAKSLKEAQESILKDHKEVVAKLAVEVARRILARQVEQGDYKIESIVAQALDGVGTSEDVVVRLNPDDMEALRKALKKDDVSKGIKLVADPQIGRAECLVEWSKGIIQSAIDQQLERVNEALKKA